MPIQPRSAADVRTRRAIVDLLKTHGAMDARTLAERLSLTDMAVRQHLYALRDEGMAGYDEQPRPVGRPAKMWRLTDAAGRWFPDCHADLTVSLIGAVRQTFGEAGIEKLLAARAKQQGQTYGERLRGEHSVAKKVRALARIRTEEGYMAEVTRQKDGSLLFVENHCPICTAATSCAGLCDAELQVFEQVLGDGVTVTRTEHIVSGARRCAYRVCEVQSAGRRQRR